MEKVQLSTTRRIVGELKKARSFIVDILFPSRCISCGKEDSYFCEKCRFQIPEENVSGIRDVISLWKYDNEKVRKAIWLLKYRGKQTLARELASSLYDKLLEAVAEDASVRHPLGKPQKYLLIPIPITQKRRKRRGYNQAELLAREISILNPDFFFLEKNALMKIKETPSQVAVHDRELRLRNIQGSFAISDASKIAGKSVILIDDVTTTGATIMEARRILLKARARHVLAATLAH